MGHRNICLILQEDTHGPHLFTLFRDWTQENVYNYTLGSPLLIEKHCVSHYMINHICLFPVAKRGNKCVSLQKN